MSKVVVVRYYGSQENRALTEEEYKILLSAGIRALGGEKSASATLRKYLPSRVVGIKTNCLARRQNSTPVPLTDALSSLLIEAGFAENDLVVWERTNRELADGGYKLNAANRFRRCLGTDTNGVGYSDDFYTSEEVSSLVSRILTEIVDLNINLPVLKDHSVAGLSAGMKNMYGAIHNPNKCHGNNCDPFCAHVNNLKPIKSKNRLTIIDAVRVQYDGGPGFVRDHLSFYDGLIISDDPVAADRVGLEIVEHLRGVNGMPSLEKAGRPVKYLSSAEKLGLGQADLNQISLNVIRADKNGRESTGELF